MWLIYILLILVVAAILFGLFSVIYRIVKGIREKRPKVAIYFSLLLVSFIIMATSWIFNMGWYRFFLTLIPIPFIHMVAFFILNLKVISKADASKTLEKYTIYSFITYVITYLAFPDGGDIGPMYVFYGLIQNDTVAKIMFCVAFISVIANIFVMILQGDELRRIKRQEMLQAEET